MNHLAKYIEEHIGSTPKAHFVLGSGLGSTLEEIANESGWNLVGQIGFEEIPELKNTTAPGHQGKYYFLKKESHLISIQSGRLHGFEGHNPRDVVKTVTEVFDAGTQTFILSNAAGSLQKSFSPGSCMVLEDHFNFTGKNPLIGENPCDENGKVYGERFPDMTQAYDIELSKELKNALISQNLEVHSGTYIGHLGPNYETTAENYLFSKWGMGAVGMSTVWEVIALRHRGARVAALSFMSNFVAGLLNRDELLDHEDVLKIGKEKAPLIIKAFLKIGEKI